jgi:hypothetical protein
MGVQVELPSFLSSQYVEVSGQGHISTALPPGRELPLPIGKEAV